MVIPQGVKLGEEPATKTVVYEKTALPRRATPAHKIFIAVVIVIAIAVCVLLYVVLHNTGAI